MGNTAEFKLKASDPVKFEQVSIPDVMGNTAE